MTLAAKSVSWTISKDKDDNLGNKGKNYIPFLQIRLLNKKVPNCLLQLSVSFEKEKKMMEIYFLTFYWTARNFVFSRATLFFGGSFLRCRISLEKSFNFFIFYFSRIITRISWSFFFSYVFFKA